MAVHIVYIEYLGWRIGWLRCAQCIAAAKALTTLNAAYQIAAPSTAAMQVQTNGEQPPAGPWLLGRNHARSNLALPGVWKH